MKICIMFLIVFLVATSYIKAETATVVTKENTIREDCKFYSPLKIKVKFNDEMVITSQQGDWYRVKFQGVEGCIHLSAINKKYISVSELEEADQGSASVQEVSLAGKGFINVEQRYKNRNPSVNYRIVEEIESIMVSDKEVSEFVKYGRLHLP